MPIYGHADTFRLIFVKIFYLHRIPDKKCQLLEPSFAKIGQTIAKLSSSIHHSRNMNTREYEPNYVCPYMGMLTLFGSFLSKYFIRIGLLTKNASCQSTRLPKSDKQQPSYHLVLANPKLSKFRGLLLVFSLQKNRFFTSFLRNYSPLQPGGCNKKNKWPLQSYKAIASFQP